MRKIILNTITILFSMSLFANDYNYFRYGNLPFDVDYFTGNSFYNLDSYYSFNNCTKIDNAEIDIEESSECYKMKLVFKEDGFLDSVYSDYHEGYFNKYEYNENGYYIKKSDIDFYKYSSDNTRELYYHNKFEKKETIEKIKDGYIIYTERFNPNINDLSLDSKTIYKYEGNKILSLENITYNRLEKVDYVYNYEFEYAGDKLQKIIIKGNNQKAETIRNIISLKYDIEGNLFKVINEHPLRPSENKVIELFNYDEYGNWHYSKAYRRGELYKIVNRSIKYDYKK